MPAFERCGIEEVNVGALLCAGVAVRGVAGPRALFQGPVPG